MTAILKYPGGKWRIAEWIISHFPSHKVYCEPFFGSGAVFFRKQPVNIETINDIDNNIVNLFEVCRDYTDELARLVSFTPFARQEFINCNKLADNKIERARQTLVRYHQSFGSTNSSPNTWKNSQTSNSPNNARYWDKLPQVIMMTLDRLKQAQIENINALKLIERYNSEETLLYVDPPYLQGLRKRNMYKHEMKDTTHMELLELLKNSKSKIVLSAYDNEMYNTYLPNWNTVEKETTVQLGNKRIEKLYMNF